MDPLLAPSRCVPFSVSVASPWPPRCPSLLMRAFRPETPVLAETLFPRTDPGQGRGLCLGHRCGWTLKRLQLG